jgi:hypothetical protein
VTEEKIVVELAKIGFSNIQDYLKLGKDGEPIFNYAQISRDQAAAIQEITIEDFRDGRGDDARDIRRIRFKLADKRQALVDLGRHLGLFVDGKHLHLNVANFFSEKPPSMDEWKKEIELVAQKNRPRLRATQRLRGKRPGEPRKPRAADTSSAHLSEQVIDNNDNSSSE